MKVLVTGAAGFIGSKVCELLLRNGHVVFGLDNLNDAYDVRLKRWRLSQLQGKPGFEFQMLDIMDREGLMQLFTRLTADGDVKMSHATGAEQPWQWAVVNLAARAGVRQSVENPWVYIDTNVTGTLNLLELSREFGVRKFVLASTSSLYGASTELPFSENAPTDGPLSPYAASKKAAEGLCFTYHYLYGIDVSVLRYFTVYGPGGRPDMSLFRFVQWISEGRPLTVYGDGTQSRDFTYVDDIALGTVAALRPIGYEVINLGSDKPVVLNDAICLLERLLGRQGRIERQDRHAADVQATWADIEKARRLLDWRPETQFEDGAARLVSWYQDNRDWASQVET